MKSWKTLLGGLISLLPMILPLFGVQVSPEQGVGILSVGATIVGVAAKDSNVTGGTVDNNKRPKLPKKDVV